MQARLSAGAESLNDGKRDRMRFRLKDEGKKKDIFIRLQVYKKRIDNVDNSIKLIVCVVGCKSAHRFRRIRHMHRSREENNNFYYARRILILSADRRAILRASTSKGETIGLPFTAKCTRLIRYATTMIITLNTADGFIEYDSAQRISS